MHLLLGFLLPLLTLYYSPQIATAFSTSSPSVLTQGSSLFVEKKDQLVSPNRLFTAEFHEIGQNAYYFAIWFSEPMLDGSHTLVWMANRDAPVNGKRSRSLINLSSGIYKLYFDNDNVVRLLYRSNDITSVYWPKPWLLTWDAGRSTFNNSRFALLDSRGHFQSTDNLTFTTTDYGEALQRRLTLDVDGNIRVYSLKGRSWRVSWQAISKTCAVHGICGTNSICTYNSKSGRTCICMHGYKIKDHTDLSLGCEPTYDLYGHPEKYEFIKLPNVEFYGFDSDYMERSSFKECKKTCLKNSNCKALQYTFNEKRASFRCYVKTLLFNGHYKDTPFNPYLKLPKSDVLSYNNFVGNKSGLYCSSSIIQLKGTYKKKSANGSLKFMLWFSIIVGVIEVASFVFFYYITKQPSSTKTQTYLAIATGFKRFTYAEIVKASNNFKEEIGRGSGGIVYKGILPDNRVLRDGGARDDNERLEQKRLWSHLVYVN
ncbi:hypothetical protein L1987_05955 [Smallanthus sonchifolius]|uniref:Uncharacterized protein n=1 Tax=Smallanthus sonchifolius TaxID=185202 RepID=A0ACB9JWZ5_9ASTR|nr:hypothetical protein L1987_05955 [Smallanthus sonchifolius]